MTSTANTVSKALCCGLLLLAALPTQAAEADKLVPGSSEIVASINVRQILQSALFQKHGKEQVDAALARSTETQKTLKALDFDPLKDIHSITVGATTDPTAKQVLVVVHGKYDLDKIGQAAASFAEKNPEFKIHKEGNLQILEGESGGEAMFASFLNGQTLVLSPSKDYLVSSTRGANKALSPVLQGAIKSIDANQSVWLAALVTEKMKDELAKNPQTQQLAGKLQAITGTLNLTDAALAQLSVHTTDAQSANQVKMLFTQILPLLKVLAQGNEEAGPILNEVLNNLKIDSDQSSVSVTLKVTEEMIQKATNQAGQNEPQP